MLNIQKNLLNVNLFMSIQFNFLNLNFMRNQEEHYEMEVEKSTLIINPAGTLYIKKPYY